MPMDPEVFGRALRNGDECEIRVNYIVAEYGFLVHCNIILHEYGHLVGLGHSEDPTNLMFPYMTGENYTHICRRERRAREDGCNKKRTKRERRACRTRWALSNDKVI